MRRFLFTVLSLLSLVGVSRPAVAESRLEMPGAFVQELLIKNTFAAVNQANLTGNYTVLSDLASSGLRSRSRGTDFERAFRGLREQKVDMSPVLCLRPQLTQQPALDEAGRLRLVGHFATQPLAMQFDFVFQHTAEGWMLDDISIATVRSQPANPQAQSHASAPAATIRTANYGHSEPARSPFAAPGPTAQSPPTFHAPRPPAPVFSRPSGGR